MQNINHFSNQPSKADKNWLIIFIVTSVIIIISSITFNIATKEVVPTQVNTLKSATPGFEFTQNIKNNFGTPLEVKKTELGTEYNYKSEFPTHNTKVVVSEDNIVLFTSERLSYNPEHLLASYTSEFGNPQLILDYYKISESVKANVFLNAGVVIFAHIKDGSVEAIWRFVPTTEENFMNSWGKELTTEEHGPEAF